MLIIVEGVDGSGKSTLVKNLLEDGFASSIIEVNRKSKNLYMQYMMASISNEIFIMDRSFITEVVYRIDDGTDPETFNLFRLVDKICKNCKIIYCKTDSSFSDSMKRGEENVTTTKRHNNISMIYDIVISIIKNYSDLKVMEYSWKKDSYDKIINFITEET